MYIQYITLKSVYVYVYVCDSPLSFRTSESIFFSLILYKRGTTTEWGKIRLCNQQYLPPPPHVISYFDSQQRKKCEMNIWTVFFLMLWVAL